MTIEEFWNVAASLDMKEDCDCITLDIYYVEDANKRYLVCRKHGLKKTQKVGKKGWVDVED